MMGKYKAYYHRFGSIQYEEFKSQEDALEYLEIGEDEGELFADCIVDDKNIVVHDCDAESQVIGREQPKSRIGEIYIES